MEDNVNFDNEVLAYLTIRKVLDIRTYNYNLGPTDREPQAIYLGPSRDQRGPQWLHVCRAPSQTSN
jgi:hypothetical protein